MRPRTAKPKQISNEYTKEIQFLQQQKLVALGGDLSSLPPIFQKNPAFLVLENELQAELFNARCHDTGETVSIERAKIFKEEYNKINSKKFPEVLNLYSMRIGVTTVIALANLKPHYTTINLSDNTLGDYAIHAIKTLLNNIPLKSLSLASNMISHQGLSQIIEELCKNKSLKFLDLGILEGSIRKNSLGLEGAKLVTQLMLSNKNIETLKLQDNSFTSAGGEVIGNALKNNKVLRNLKVAENELKNQGIETILEYGKRLESLDLSKNMIKPAEKFRIFISENPNLIRLNLEYNELGPKGVEYIAQGLYQGQSQLKYLNLRGNGIGDRGLDILSEALMSISELDLAMNDITPEGIMSLAQVLPDSNIRVLNLSKNLLGDESLVMLANNSNLQKLDVSSSRVSDKGFLHFIQEECENLISLKANDNYISEKVEKVLLDILENNKIIQELQVTGNRLSLCCLNRISRILARNIKIEEEKQPNQIRTEIYRLKYEQKKILMAKEKLNHQEQEIRQIEDAKHKVMAEMEKIKQQEQSRRQGFQDRINEHIQLIEKKKKVMEDKVQDFERVKVKKMEEIDQLKKEFDTQYQKRRELEIEYEKLQNILDQQEQQYKEEVNRLEESIQEKKNKTEEVTKQTAILIEELSKLQKQQQNSQQSNPKIQLDQPQQEQQQQQQQQDVDQKVNQDQQEQQEKQEQDKPKPANKPKGKPKKKPKSPPKKK